MLASERLGGAGASTELGDARNVLPEAAPSPFAAVGVTAVARINVLPSRAPHVALLLFLRPGLRTASSSSADRSVGSGGSLSSFRFPLSGFQTPLEPLNSP